MTPRPRLAVLIDAENVSHRLAGRIFELAERLGTIVERRLYGDFSGPAKGWGEAAARHSLDARHVFAPTKGKNGADMALALGASRLLHDGAAEGICLVSSDGDFAAVAKEIRAAGGLAYGIGGATAPPLYQAACTTWLPLDTPVAAAEQHPALAVLRAAMETCQPHDGWYHLAQVAAAARRMGMRPEDYGASKFSALFAATGQFVLDDRQRLRLAAPQLRAVAGGREAAR